MNSADSTDKSKTSSPNSDSSPLSPRSWSSRSQCQSTHPTTILSFAEIRLNPQRMESSQNIHDPQIRETQTGPHLLQATTPFHIQYFIFYRLGRKVEFSLSVELPGLNSNKINNNKTIRLLLNKTG